MPLLDRELLKKTGIMSVATGQLLAYAGSGWWIGSWLDEKWNSAPWLKAILAMLGFVYAGWRIWRTAKDLMK